MIATILVGDAPIRLWGLTGRQRLERQLGSLSGVELVPDRAALDEASAQARRVLLLRADYVFELRALKGLLELDGLLVRDGSPVAGCVEPRSADVALSALEDGDPREFPTFGVEALQAFERDLRKLEPPMVAAITSEKQDELEDRLYGASYKGITDFVTKWWWPRPARTGVRLCTRLGVSPNAVTTTGFVLMLAACWFFYTGQYAAGLVPAWLMTYLDTVDGKLARVTARSSFFGHLLDHGMDIIHPPFWYLLWGLSLQNVGIIAGVGETQLYVAIFAGYVGGRVIEGVFNLLGDTSIFAWRPFDAYFRLFTARRNPCLVLLTLAWTAGSPAAGLWLVAAWTVVSTLVMLARLVFGLWVRINTGRLHSWLAEPDAARQYPRAYTTFSATRRAYG